MTLITLKVYGESSPITEFKKLNNFQKSSYFILLPENDKIKYIDYFNKEVQILKNKTNDSNSLLNINISIGLIEKIKGNNVQSILTLNKILIENSNKNPIKEDYLMIVYFSLQESYLKLNIFSKVIEINSEIEKLHSKGIEYPLWNYNFQSRLYFNMNKYDKAIDLLKKEIRVLQNSPKRDSLIIPSALNDLGFYYFIVKDFKNSEKFYHKSLQLAKKSLDHLSSDYKTLYLTINNNLARLKTFENNNKEAISIIKDSVFPNTTDTSEIYTEACFILADAYLNSNQLDKYLDIKKINILHKDDYPIYKHMFLNYEVRYLIKANKYREALEMYKKLYKYRTDEFESEKIKKNNSVEINYLLDENENTLREKNKEFEQKQKKTLRYIVIFSGCIIALILILYINIYRKKKQIETMHQSILSQNSKIEQSLKEKDFLLKEIHHRVKNNLQIISSILDLQQLNTDNIQLKNILQEGKNRIQTIALLHRSMYQKELYSEINLKEYLEELMPQIQSSFSKNSDVKVDFYIDSTLLPLDIAIPLSLIITEIISNSYKHAFDNQIDKKIKLVIKNKHNKNYTLKISDNGCGFNPELYNNSNSLGLDLICGLTEQINGKLTVKSSINKGTKFKINFSNYERT
ncbi:histidine kinase dimerization/phosphoacceptor domain -containing protein [Flavobacterium chuncheonense]|uniref:histidine kinase n=1 Tax=Flavobacterium chuncheonense TaxID=2026653 RepID=A0ABW5YJC7_9FLAO